jgi:hypothetical protein
MSHVFEGEPDARQSPDTAFKPTRFRPTYRALTPEEKLLHDEIKAAAQILEAMYLRVNAGREIALAMTKLEESVMWAIKALTGPPP